MISEARKEEAGCDSGSSRTEFPCGDRTLLYLGCGDGYADLGIRDIDAYTMKGHRIIQNTLFKKKKVQKL